MSDKAAFAKGDRVRLLSCGLVGVIADLVKEKGEVVEFVVTGEDAGGKPFTCNEVAGGLINLTRAEKQAAERAAAAEAEAKKAGDVEARIADAVAAERARILALKPEELDAERAAAAGGKK